MLEQSPIQVLTELNVAWLQWSYKNWYFQVDKPLRPWARGILEHWSDFGASKIVKFFLISANLAHFLHFCPYNCFWALSCFKECQNQLILKHTSFHFQDTIFSCVKKEAHSPISPINIGGRDSNLLLIGDIPSFLSKMDKCSNLMGVAAFIWRRRPLLRQGRAHRYWNNWLRTRGGSLLDHSYKGVAAYQLGNTSSCTIIEVKQGWAWLVLGWQTVQVLSECCC